MMDDIICDWGIVQDSIGRGRGEEEISGREGALGSGAIEGTLVC